MRDDILGKAVLAIATCIDIGDDEYESKVMYGTEVYHLEDPAFFIVNKELFRRFRQAWEMGIPAEKMPDGKPCPPLEHIHKSSSIIRALIQYVSLELYWSDYHLPYERVYDMLMPKYDVIVYKFLHDTKQDLLTALASRKCIHEAIRAHLIQSNIRSDSKTRNRLRNSNRTQVIFDMFKEYFHKRSATRYLFEGRFSDFVIHAYKSYFYTNHKSDIWKALSADDFAKREVEMDIHTVKYSERKDEFTDIFVRDYLINIGQANTKLFKHGHKENAYDLYYLILCHLCEKYAENVNKELDGFAVQFVDPYSRNGGAHLQKGEGAKINNAKELIPVLFDHISAGDFNVNRMLDLRREAFLLGRSDLQGNNPVWKCDTSGAAERQFDTKEGIPNFIIFEVVFKGVASAYNLMRALVERDRDLVDEYIKGRPEKDLPNKPKAFSEWFTARNIYRYMDYLSSLDYLPLIRKLQEEAGVRDGKEGTGELDPDCGELLDFEGMVGTWGMELTNTSPRANEMRAHARVHGFLHKAKIKGTGNMNTPFEQRRSVYRYLTAIPYALVESELKRSATFRPHLRGYGLCPEFTEFAMCGNICNKRLYMQNDSGAIEYAIESYRDLHSNTVMLSNKEYAKLHMKDVLLNTQAGETSYAWSIGSAMFPGLLQVDSLQNGKYAFMWLDIPMFRCSLGSTFIAPNEDDLHYGKGSMYVTYGKHDNEGEFSWLNSAGENACRGLMTVLNNPIALQLAAGIQPDSNGDVYYEDIMGGEVFDGVSSRVCNRVYESAVQKLQASLGFELYIGIRDYQVKDVTSVLKAIPVYQEYTGQTRLYRERLSELSWMQEEFIQLLQLMFTYCCYVVSPESGCPQEDIKLANSLFKGLMSHCFKKKDLDKFFEKLYCEYMSPSGKVLPQYRWPSRVVNYSGHESSSKAREPINPVWALLLGGIFTDLAEQSGVKPVTQYEAGPYEQFMHKAGRWDDASDRFILLHGFLYEKTRFIKLLRDAYTITFGVIPEDNSTLTCEFGSVLNVRGLFDPHHPAWYNKVAITASLGDSVTDFVQDAVVQDVQDFGVLLRALDAHYTDCAQDLRDLVNYDIAADSELSSKFDAQAELFKVLPVVNNSEILDQIRGQFNVDRNKFFLYGNDYFKAHYGDKTLYLHMSGHFLAVDHGKYEVFTLNTQTKEELRLYENILIEGQRYGSNHNYK